MGSLSKKLKDLKKELEKADEIAEKFIKNDIYASIFFSISNDLYCITGTDGYFKLVNTSWTEALQYTPEEIIGKSYLDFIHPDDIESSTNFAKNVRLGNIGIDFHNRYKAKDGSYVTLSWNCKQIPDGTIFSTVRVVR